MSDLVFKLPCKIEYISKAQVAKFKTSSLNKGSEVTKPSIDFGLI